MASPRRASGRSRSARRTESSRHRSTCRLLASNLQDAAKSHRERSNAAGLRVLPNAAGRTEFRARFSSRADAPADARAWRLRREVHDRLHRGISCQLVSTRETMPASTRSEVEFLSCQRVSVARRLAAPGLDSRAGSPRLVSVVLPVLHGPAVVRRCAADSAMAGHCAPRDGDPEELRAARPRVPAPSASGCAPLGVRQPTHLAESLEGIARSCNRDQE